MTGEASVLDRLDAVDDPQGMLDFVEQMPELWRRGLTAGLAAPAPDVRETDVRNVVVAGMGGSGIGGDIARAVGARHGRVPIVVVKGYELPPFAGPDTFVVAVSHSGNTEETLACYEAAAAAGCSRFAVTSGGSLGRRAAEDGVPTATVSASGQPRANLPTLSAPVLVALERAGALSGVRSQLEGLPAHLDAVLPHWVHTRDTTAHPVKRLAMSLDGHVPVFYGAEGWPAVAAMRAKCQVNENAKTPAFHAPLPEMNHNEVVGWRAPANAQRHFSAVLLRSTADEHARVARRFDVLREVISGAVAGVHAFEAEGPTPLARFAATVLFVDLLSVYLAYLRGVDPTPVDAIDHLKRALGEPDPPSPA